jgi:glutamate dehydrogenase (NAD(P)+)
MLKTVRVAGKHLLINSKFKLSNIPDNRSFLKMVESYFDKAGKYTGITKDKLDFYKKSDNVVKFNLTLIRGI